MMTAAFGQHSGSGSGGGGSHSSSGGGSHSGGFSSGSHSGGSSFQGSHSSYSSSGHSGSSLFHGYSRQSSSGFGHFGSSFSHSSSSLGSSTAHSSGGLLGHSEGSTGHGPVGTSPEHQTTSGNESHGLFSSGSSRESSGISKQMDRSGQPALQHLSSTSHSNYTGSHNQGSKYSNSGTNWNGGHDVAQVHGYHGHNHNWRNGYHAYYSGWHDSFFFFGGYLFDPWGAPCVLSPWYLYPSLPGYLPYSSVIIANDDVDWNAGGYYAYDPDDDPNSYGNPDLNYSLDELTKIFNNSDEYALSEMIGSEAVGIYNDGNYMYSVNGTEFHQMMMDNIHAVENANFSIMSVKLRNDQAIVRARHEFSSPDGGNEVVYQEYRLQQIDGKFVIVDFNTSKNPSAAQTFF